MAETENNQYSLAGWLAIISAVLLVPEIVLGVLVAFVSPGLKVFIAPLHVANLCIGIYILYMFRRLLNRNFDFHKADTLIILLIAVNIASFVIGLAGLLAGLTGLGQNAELIISWITLALFIPFSVLTIVFGVVLFKLTDDLYGLKKPYASTTILSGVCGATVILAPVGLLAAVAALFMLGMIFLRARREADIL